MAMTHVRKVIGVAVALTAVLAGASCGEVARTGQSPVMLVILQLSAAAGGGSTFAGFLLSDVLTEGSVTNDSGRASMVVRLKNPGAIGAPTTPSTLNAVTITRYRVRFERTDGRNTPGVDVPYGFDGGVTVTVPELGTADVVFDLVRHQNKSESPLINLRSNGGQQIISTIAVVTFYGQDLAGNEIEVTGNIQVNFADFADPA
jgi:hypothetical protein